MIHDKKNTIYELTRSFLTELIYKGYSKSYIYYRTKQFFFDYEQGSPFITSPKVISQYFNEFDSGGFLKTLVLAAK
jgi:hypothetical protein